jgi:hypothetical protein
LWDLVLRMPRHKYWRIEMIEPKDRFVTIRMPIEIFKVVKAQADSQTRSISRQVVHLIKTALENEK